MEDYHIDVDNKDIKDAKAIGLVIKWIFWIGVASWFIHIQYFR